ncbi:MAG: discoidin domain-containing protein, partial [Bacteroidales bacterium]|nr:discoidin domain-containing protein [Bacteroidales bacterium]
NALFSFSGTTNANVASSGIATSLSGDASMAIDGNDGTRWESAHGTDAQWLAIKLDKTYDLSLIKIHWEGANAKAYSIKASQDSINWTEIHAETAGAEGDRWDNIAVNTSAQYLVVTCTERNLTYGYSIWEMEVYEAAPVEKDASLSMIQVDGTDLVGYSLFDTIYTYDVAVGESTVPTVTATAVVPAATVVVTPAADFSESTQIVVTSTDNSVTKTYTLTFVESIPGTAAPTPSKAAADVIAPYSDSYAAIATNLNPAWWQATIFSEVLFDGNKTLKYAKLNYQGLEYAHSDVSSMEFVHLDYFTANATALKFSLIGDKESAYDIATEKGIVLGQWVSLDIPLTHFTEPDLSDVSQFKTEGNGTVYLDNLYFWKAPTAATADVTLTTLTVDGDTIANFAPSKKSYQVALPFGTVEVPVVSVTTTNPNAKVSISEATSLPGTTTVKVVSEGGLDSMNYTVAFEPSIPATAAPVPTPMATDVISVYSDGYTSVVSSINPAWSQATVMTELVIDGNKTMEYANLDYQGVEYTTSDVSAMKFVHLDYFTVNATALEFYLIADGENSYNINTELGITTGQWVSVDIPLSYFSAAGRDLTQAIQFKTTGNGTVFIDNLYFWKEGASALKEATAMNINAYPNPVQDFLYFDTSKTIKSVSVFDWSGRNLLNATMNTKSIDLSSLNSGTYLVKVATDTSVKIMKIMKK